MKKRFILLIGILLALGFQPCLKAQGNLRQSVCVVRADIDSTTASNLMSYSLWLSRNNERNASRGISSLAKGGFGSGVVVEKNGGLYLLTNSHVVGVGKTATLNFIDGLDTLVMSKVPVIYQDDDADMAVLRLPDDNAKISTINLSDKVLNDGDEVWSAGFPGLGGRPSWQVGQGIVSNHSLVIPETKATYIQHTAQVDRGSSGGPLLVKNDGEYEVVGLNTLKVFDRDGVNLAIPTSTMKQVLDEAVTSGNKSTLQTYLLAIDTIHVNDYANLYGRVPDSIINKQKEMFEKGDYLKGLALVVDYASENSLLKHNKHKTSKIKSTSSRQNLAGLDRDYGFFYKTSIEATIWDFNIGGSVNVCMNHMLGVQYFIGGLSIGYVHIKNSPVDNSEEPNPYLAWYIDDGEHLNGFLGQVHLGAQVPFGLRKVEFVPYIIPNVGFGGAKDFGLFVAYGFKIGLDVEVPADKSAAFVAGLGYSFKRYNFCGEVFDGYQKLNANGLSISVGVRF